MITAQMQWHFIVRLLVMWRKVKWSTNQNNAVDVVKNSWKIYSHSKLIYWLTVCWTIKFGFSYQYYESCSCHFLYHIMKPIINTFSLKIRQIFFDMRFPSLKTNCGCLSYAICLSPNWIPTSLVGYRIKSICTLVVCSNSYNNAPAHYLVNPKTAECLLIRFDIIFAQAMRQEYLFNRQRVYLINLINYYIAWHKQA